MTRGIVQEQQPFDVAWRTIDGLKIRYATSGRGGEKIVLFSSWPESIFAFAPVWGGLTRQFEVNMSAAVPRCSPPAMKPISSMIANRAAR